MPSDADPQKAVERAASNLVATVRSDGVLAFANGALSAYCGFAFGELDVFDPAAFVHPADLPQASAAFREAFLVHDPFGLRLRLLRHDGAYRRFDVHAMPAFDAAGSLDRYIVVATEEYSDRADVIFTVLERLGDVLGATDDPIRALQRVAESAVPTAADWCAIALLDERRRPGPPAIACADPAASDAWEIVRAYAHEVTGSNLAADARDCEPLTGSDLFAVVAPIVARNERLGTITFASGAHREIGTGERRLAEIIGKRLGVAITNAHIYERERHISAAFQQAALPSVLPSVPGLDLHAVYVAAEREAEIGGDWYDAFTLEDGRVVLSIGDVAGKGLEAAVLMGSLRQAIRVVALKGFGPAEILAAASLLVARERGDRFATAFVGIIDPSTWSLSYATAAHPLPIFRRPDGSTMFLKANAAPPLGLIDETPHTATLVSIPPESMVVLYTDGLIEATRDIFVGERRLHASVGSLAVLYSGDPAKLIRDMVLYDGVHDDVAVLTVAFGRSKRWSFDARDAMSAHGARSSFLAALQAEGARGGDYIGSEVIFGELIGNVVRHAPGPIDVTLDWTAHEPVLHVIDRGPGFLREPKLPDPLSESGRGLFIIETLARGFEAAPIPGRGTHVIVRLPVERAEASCR